MSASTSSPASKQARRERRGVLDRLRTALSHEWQHRVAGIAEQRHPIERPTRQGFAIEHRPDERLIDGINDAFDLRMPALVGHAQVGHITGLRPGFADPIFSLNVTNEI